jgi:hypothetical protein
LASGKGRLPAATSWAEQQVINKASNQVRFTLLSIAERKWPLTKIVIGITYTYYEYNTSL